jgi:hypothetical protein
MFLGLEQIKHLSFRRILVWKLSTFKRNYSGATIHHLQAYIIKIIIKEKSQLVDSSILFKLRLLTNT